MGWHTNRLLAGIGKTSFDGSAELKQSSRAPGITGITVTVHSIAAARMICYRGTVSRLARLVVPGLPYHVTQRGNGGQRVFFSGEDYACYRALLAEATKEARVAVWAWCLMPNHVHLILRPDDEDGLRRALARALPVHGTGPRTGSRG